MKVAFVVGFFSHVETALAGEFPKQLETRSLVCISQLGINREGDINKFKSLLYDRLASGAQEVLVMLAVLPGKDWVIGNVQKIIAYATQKHPKATIKLVEARHAKDHHFVIKAILDFGLDAAPQLGAELVRERLGSERVLCVSAAGRTAIRTAFCRAGFPQECWDEFFDEIQIDVAKNSNLVDRITTLSQRYNRLLYAWYSLRTLPPEVKRRYTDFAYEAPHAGDVVALFKRWFLKQGASQ